MFVVATVARKTVPGGENRPTDRHFPIVFEDDETPNCSSPIAHRDTRGEAQKLADALNKVLGG